MSVLPVELRHWQGALGFAMPELVAAIGAWLPRLAGLIGPLRVSPEAHWAGEPDGYAGLSRRGSPERLLLSEWAMAELYPQEFLRRAAMGEQLYLRPFRKEKQGARLSVVLLDMGPDLIGAPRLGMLAVLLVLAHRAQVAGAELRWGVLQDPDAGLAPWSQVQVLTLLRARCSERPSDAHREAWGLVVEAEQELWTVGGPDAVMDQASAIEIQDPALVGVSALWVKVPKAPPLQLELPVDRVVAGLLHRPWSLPKASIKAPAPNDWPCSSLHLCGKSDNLLLQQGQALRLIRLGTWRRGRPSTRGVQALSARPVAYGWRGRKSVWIQEKDGVLSAPRLARVQGWEQAEDGVALPAGFVLPDAARPCKELHVLNPQDTGSRRIVLLRDAVCTLWALDFAAGEAVAVVEQASQLHAADWAGCSVLADQSLLRLSWGPQGPLGGTPVVSRLELRMGLLVGSDAECFWLDAQGRWAQVDEIRRAWRQTLAGAWLVGVSGWRQIFVCADRLRVMCLGHSQLHEICTLPAPAIWCGMSARGTAVVWRSDGVLQKLDLSQRGGLGLTLEYEVGVP